MNTTFRFARSFRALGAALGTGLLFFSLAGVVAADTKKKDPPMPAVAAEPPLAKKAISHGWAGVSWGQNTKTVTASIEKLIDEDYKPQLAAVQPGVKMVALESKLAEEKAAFGRTRVDFKGIPTGYDQTALAGEYTYNNKEHILELKRAGKTTFFFFIQDKLWKIVEERKFAKAEKVAEPPKPDPKKPDPKKPDPKKPDPKDPPKEPAKPVALTDYPTVASQLANTLGVVGRALQPDAKAGRSYQEVDWKDATTQIRIQDRGQGSKEYAVIYVDVATLAQLDKLRVNKKEEKPDIDPSIAAALRGSPLPPPSASAKKK